MLSSKLLGNVLDLAPDALIIIDAAGVIRFANRQVAALFGHEPGAVTGRPVEVLLPERFRQRHVAHREGYSANVRVRPMGMGLELFGIRADGSEFPVEISLSPIHEGDSTLVAAAIRDVTERKRVEAELKAARLEAEHANLGKSRFLATASHDLRQPLQTLGLLNGALRRKITDADCQDILQQQEDAIDAMSRLLNALLDISKLESGAIKLQPADFPLAMLVEELRRDFASVADSKGLRLAIDSTDVRVHSDPALLGQLLRNLVSNAIKYTPRGSVELSCHRRGENIRVEVRDSGVGIAANQLPLIFDEFYQVGVSPNTSRDGYGLGLSIVRRICKLLDLHLDVQSTPGAGSVFAVELPLARDAAAAADRPPTQRADTAAPMSGARILLVEDEAGVRNAMRTLLKMEGYMIIAAATAEEAHIELQGEDAFDLLITDYHLEAGRTGTEVIASARQKLGADFKAILVTGDTSSAIRELRGDDCLRITSKPINSRELLQLIRAMLSS